MTDENIRLECLKLAHYNGRETAQVVEQATAYYEWVTANAAGAEPEEPVTDAPVERKKPRPKVRL